MSWTDVDFTKVLPPDNTEHLLADLKQQHPTPILNRINMQKRGGEYIATCPFHAEKTPSFTLYRKSDGWRAKCFGCGWFGDVLNFVMEHDGVNFKEGLARIQSELDNSQQEAEPWAEKPFLFPSSALPILTERLLNDARGLAFLKSRGINPEVAKSLQLGLTSRSFGVDGHPQLALCIPRFDYEGALLGLKYRALEPQDKTTKWSQEPGSEADSLYAPLPVKGDTLFIVEGELDCALALSLGVDAGCYFGTSGVPSGNPSSRFLGSIAAIKSRGQRIVIIPDSDEVGRAAALRLQQHLGTGSIALLPDGFKDLGEFWQREPQAAKRWLEALSASTVIQNEDILTTAERRPEDSQVKDNK